MAYVYRHIRLDKNEPFYIGIGTSKYYNRAYRNKNRSNLWQRIANKSGYEVEILFDNLTWDEACNKEKEFIALYGRIDLKNGCLANMTDGGDGAINIIISKEHRAKVAEANKKRIFTDEDRKNISIRHTGRIKSEESKIKLSNSLKNSQKFKEAIKNLTSALKLLPKNEDATKLLAEANEGLKASKIKPKKVEKNPEINFDAVNGPMKDQAENLLQTLAGEDKAAELKQLQEADSIMFEKLISEARIAFDNKDYQTSSIKYKEASELEHIAISAKYIAEDNHIKASLAFDKAEEVKKSAEAANTDLAKYTAAMIQGKEEMAAKKYEEAVKCFKDAVDIYPHYAEATDSLAKAEKLLEAFNLLKG